MKIKKAFKWIVIKYTKFVMWIGKGIQGSMSERWDQMKEEDNKYRNAKKKYKLNAIKQKARTDAFRDVKGGGDSFFGRIEKFDSQFALGKKNNGKKEESVLDRLDKHLKGGEKHGV